MAAFPIDSMRRRRAAIQQAIGYLTVLYGRMQACGQHPCSDIEFPDYRDELQRILDAWPLDSVEKFDVNDPPVEKQRVWIIWGSGEKPAPMMYEFDTLLQLNAFLEGVDQANGWMDFAQYDTAEAAEKAYKEETDEEEDDEVEPPDDC